jgi:predicted Holliday junction resolvase-like endonuclease
MGLIIDGGLWGFRLKLKEKNKYVWQITTTLGIIGLVIIWRLMSKKVRQLKSELKKSAFAIKSAYIKFGKTFEHFAPFTKDFTQEEKNGFIFLGCPIDGVIFGQDKIKFIEIKTGEAQLSAKQRKIKEMINQGKVEFMEVRY